MRHRIAPSQFPIPLNFIRLFPALSASLSELSEYFSPIVLWSVSMLNAFFKTRFPIKISGLIAGHLGL
jgi:uncharacterized membrane protein